MNDKIQKQNDSLFYINFLFDYSDNTEKDKKFVLTKFSNIINIIFNKFIKITDNSIKTLEKFFKCKYIKNDDKNELKFLYKSLIN